MNRFLFIIALLIHSLIFSNPLKINTSAKSAILINAENGKVLFEKNSHDRFFPASTTKVATVLYVLETVSDINQWTVVTSDALEFIPIEEKHKNYNCQPHLLEKDAVLMSGLSPGVNVSLKDLIYASMLISANDASNILAESVSGSIPMFMEELNNFLQEIGCKNTYFRNPHGLHFPEHYSCASDLALILQKGIRNKAFQEIVTTRNYQPSFRDEKIQATCQLLLKNYKYYYPKIFCAKTGYTSKAGYNLVAAAKDENRTLIAVVLGHDSIKERCVDITNIFEKAFSEPKEVITPFYKGQEFEKKIPGGKQPLTALIYEDLTTEYYPSEREEFKVFIEWEPFKLPIKQGQEVGKLILKSEDKVFKEVPLIANNVVKKTYFSWIKDLFKKSP
ncbi:MAG: D-alanyl-D-alanine carboxypeptidase family protein [Chlamydiota bacterium]|jgi:D-alanyl-D-alanine carboxypeptidase (penicillin-binding protein 5/6)